MYFLSGFPSNVYSITKVKSKSEVILRYSTYDISIEKYCGRALDIKRINSFFFDKHGRCIFLLSCDHIIKNSPPPLNHFNIEGYIPIGISVVQG